MLRSVSPLSDRRHLMIRIGGPADSATDRTGFRICRGFRWTKPAATRVMVGEHLKVRDNGTCRALRSLPRPNRFAKPCMMATSLPAKR